MMLQSIHSLKKSLATAARASGSRIFALLLCGLAVSGVSAATFTVTNLNSINPGSFRSALSSANATPGPDVIVFAVAGTINLTSPLPSITDPVFIDGTTAPGYVACGAPQITLNGSASGAANGLQLLAGASGSTISALNVRSFPLNGIQLINSDGNTIRACYIGTSPDGNTAFPNGQNGIQVELGSELNVIGGSGACDGNVLSGNNGQGIALNGSGLNTVTGNLIGVNAAGTAPLGNNSIGMFLVNGSNGNTIGNIGPNERNVISNNGTGLTGNGIDVNGSSGNTFLNNYIGVDITGTAAMGNAENGMALFNAPNTTIGGNVISNHNFHAIVLNGGSNSVNVVRNTIGTNAAGTAAMGNDDSGVIVINSNNVTIGGTVAGAGNLLSGSLSEYGVFLIGSSNVTVQGNQIGTDITGTQPIPNFNGGIRIDFNSNGNTVGGSAAGAGNVIAFNTGYGVGVLFGNCNQNLISRNSFFCNTGLGIDLGGLGNNNYAAPTITSFTAAGATGLAQANDLVELYYDLACTGTCQGRDFIASVPADIAGIWAYNGPLNTSARLAALAIRTSPPANQVNNTSEFVCQVILPVEWLSFEARPDQDRKVHLHWETASEVDASHFVVERSLDGVDFGEIGLVPARNLSEGSGYAFVDPSAAPGDVFYRLRQLDFDGGYAYSEVRQVTLGSKMDLFQVADNPADGSIRFRLETAGSGLVRQTLMDQVGKELYSAEGHPSEGGWLEIASEQFSAGLYYLRVEVGGREETRKILIRHVE